MSKSLQALLFSFVCVLMAVEVWIVRTIMLLAFRVGAPTLATRLYAWEVKRLASLKAEGEELSGSR